MNNLLTMVDCWLEENKDWLYNLHNKSLANTLDLTRKMTKNNIHLSLGQDMIEMEK